MIEPLKPQDSKFQVSLPQPDSGKAAICPKLKVAETPLTDTTGLKLSPYGSNDQPSLPQPCSGKDVNSPNPVVID